MFSLFRIINQAGVPYGSRTRVAEPSEADRRSHEQLNEAAKILGLRILDNIIVTRRGYFIFAEVGLI
ncbi:MAG: hypothetical protein LC776_06885 [Acidobacteria bacterium]|nr:hypothetical protein [Acidobacteriota bacterium]